MSQEFVVLVLGIMFIVALVLVALLARDVRSGNYRKLLIAKDEHEEEELKKSVQEIRNKNLGV